MEVDVNASPSALAQYLIATRSAIGEFDRLIQGYEFQFFATLSVLGSVGLGIVGILYVAHPLFAPSFAFGIGLAGILVDIAFWRRMEYFEKLQVEIMKVTIDIEDVAVPALMRGAGVRGDFNRFKMTKRLWLAESGKGQVDTARFTVAAFGVLFVTVTIIGAYLTF